MMTIKRFEHLNKDDYDVQRFDILGVMMSAINMNDALKVVERLIAERRKGYVCVSPVSTILECYENEKIRDIVNQAALVTPDGMPSVWIGKRKGFQNMGRVYGPDLMKAVCNLSQVKGYRNFFYGATPEVLERLKTNLLVQFPKLNICGVCSPPFRALSDEEDRQLVEQINRAQADIVWVGLGSPKQDIWMAQHKDRLSAYVLCGVGAAFDFISGTKKQAPYWMQRCGLEWLFRLCTEPRRLWRRYLIGNTKFIYLLIKEKIKSINR